MVRGLDRESRRAGPSALLAFALALVSPLVAQAAPRTFVASTGSDANTATNCPVTNPCQSFAAAYSVTNANGEIIALDSAGYGSVTITNSVSIIAIDRAFVKVNASSTGITITGGSVLLENVEVTGLSNASTTGIAVSNGAHLILRNSSLVRLTTGLSITGSKTDIVNSQILFNTTGISTNGTGIDPGGSFPGAATTEARLYFSSVMGNGTAFSMTNPGASIQASTSDITILLYNGGTQDTLIIGNTTLFSGSGTGCSSGTQTNQCDHAITFSSPTAVNNVAP